ncbi:adenosylcobalamin-dependent ribonucleoside-diphosphate reductase [Chryseobacterium joostei]|uniref:Vitamin B12-dependent ribonucleotide reductase n=1 Tax=Chryseobacterium joostei TaxID=112234 RepID=A0A1N7HSE1_9FLAO|nr:adenosylcobalamin-dependent ribonucleoside-diphosphate reductase [Chryseobacterium joostei]AZA99279.1 adenosylcobalamin-dependent ribonucleoside-diphosphate reductase [Chryseobacterium joostei]SIS27736.1 ribonucleoside-diphosphate reductase class II [Chryseobacterium joostei]
MEVLTKNAIQILEDRYLMKNNEGVVTETADALFKRVAEYICGCEKKDSAKWSKAFYKVMSELKFLPNSPTLMNAGCDHAQLSACFVLPVEDSLESIFTTLKNAALIHQSGGGTGFNFSAVRPKGDLINSSKGQSSGPVSFMKIYDAATEYVKQGGKRRGANMGILNVDHPDIEEFIMSKSDKKSIENFNLSVGISNAFMKAVEDDSGWQLINPHTQKIARIISAKSLWELMVQEAWKTGDPGLIFIDAINDSNTTPDLGRIQATNPCGEVPLFDNESCNLGSVNLSRITIFKNGKYEIDWHELSRIIHIGIRFLDNVITLNHYPLPEIKISTLHSRRIGLGLMGWAELLILLNIPYASKKALLLAEKLMKFFQRESYDASEKLALERGTFPSWKLSTFGTSNRKMRNATCNSIAPTGTISVIANTSYSIEPLFALAYRRVGILEGKIQTEINAVFIKKMKMLNLWNSPIKKIVLESGNLNGCNNIPRKIKDIFTTGLDIPWKYHLLHQKAFQKYTDNAVSKTINLPEQTSLRDISDIYKTAYKYGLKGITVYRYGSRVGQVLQKCNVTGC